MDWVTQRIFSFPTKLDKNEMDKALTSKDSAERAAAARRIEEAADSILKEEELIFMGEFLLPFRDTEI